MIYFRIFGFHPSSSEKVEVGGELLMNEPRICVVGSSNMDLICKIPRLPKMGETLVGHYFHMGCGGKGANQAVMAAKLGANVTMVTKLGRDALGEITFKNYEDMGINTRYIFFERERFSGVAPILVDDSGKNLIVIVPGANDYLSPDDARRAKGAIQESDILVCQLEVPMETTIEAFHIAKQSNVLTILNPAPGQPLPIELISLSDIVAPNETETEIITGMAVETLDDAETAAKKLQDMGAQVAIITLGERGAMLVDDEGVSHIPGVETEAVDSTGAGDAFIGSLSYFLAKDKAIRDSIRCANAIAAISVTKVGTQVSFPAAKEVEELLA
jgi:ribokinase